MYGVALELWLLARMRAVLLCAAHAPSFACPDDNGSINDDLDGFVELINELRALQSDCGVALEVDGKRRGGAAVQGYALRDVLFVGEGYTLDVVASDEVRAASVEFLVKYADCETVRAAPWLRSCDGLCPETSVPLLTATFAYSGMLHVHNVCAACPN